MTSDDDFEIKPGRIKRDRLPGGRKAQTLVAQIQRVAKRAGYTRLAPGTRRATGTGPNARGRSAALAARSRASNRRVVIKARVVRQSGVRFRAAPLARHVAYLKRDGVTRDGREAGLFDARSDNADGDAFAERCGDDRHHFRFIVSPEDAADMVDLRAFTRELMDDMTHDLGTRLDWVAVDHWNTDNPHIHILLRGKADDGKDLVIDKSYIREGMRSRAEERVTVELGHRSEREIRQALEREVGAERWTSLDRSLQAIADRDAGVVDLRPGDGTSDPTRRNLLVGRAIKLERRGLATRIDPACWTLKPGLESTLRDLSIRGDIIKTMHRAMTARGHTPDVSAFTIHDDKRHEPVIGRLVERGLHDELTGDAYAVVDGIDGRTHHLRFSELEMTGDAKEGAIVELRSWEDAKGRTRLTLATRSDFSLDEQVGARGATWLDRQLVAKDRTELGNGFGREVQDALEQRSAALEGQGLATRHGSRVTFARDLILTLRGRELADVVAKIEQQTGLAHQPTAEGASVEGTYRQRVNLASGRFAMIDNGMGFELVPWRPALDQHLGQHVSGWASGGGGIEWTIGRARGLGI
ncbi:MAG: DUF3363 domain-containing protein [Sphingomonadales bacterium]|nr:DUF3363 domain-containing protein [Sphingomonadales bacterium]